MVIYFNAQKEAGGFLFLALLLVVTRLVATLIPAARAASRRFEANSWQDEFANGNDTR